MQNPKEKVISASQGHFLSELVKKAAGLVLKEDSSGSSDTVTVLRYKNTSLRHLA